MAGTTGQFHKRLFPDGADTMTRTNDKSREVSGSRWPGFQEALKDCGVMLQGEGKAQRYLDDHADMFDLAINLCREARRIFPAPAELTLKVYRDPEIEDEYLALVVRLPVYAPDTLVRIRSVSDTQDERIGEASGWLLVTTDFRPIEAQNGV
jgi:hypothetical protein